MYLIKLRHITLPWTSDRPVANTSDNSQHSQDTYPCLGGIRTRNPSKRAAEDPRFRLRELGPYTSLTRAIPQKGIGLRPHPNFHLRSGIATVSYETGVLRNRNFSFTLRLLIRFLYDADWENLFFSTPQRRQF